MGLVVPGGPIEPERPSDAPPVRLPAGVRAAIVDRARVEGLTNSKTLVALVEFALRTMPRGWQPPA